MSLNAPYIESINELTYKDYTKENTLNIIKYETENVTKMKQIKQIKTVP